MAAKAAKKSGEIIGRLRTYIPAGKASASPPLGPQLGQVKIS
jgi:ribosomal protein L11